MTETFAFSSAPAKGRRRFGLPILCGLLALAVFGAASAADLQGSFRGAGYATYGNAKAGAVSASLARSAYQGCSCRGTGGKTLSSRVSDLSAGDALTAETTESTAFTTKTESTAKVRNTSTVSGLNALGGMITADSVKAAATVDVTDSTMTPSTKGSIFKNLKIAGQSIPSDVAPNTVVALPGIGTVTLKKTSQKGRFKTDGSILVEMMAIDVTTDNDFDLPVGSKIVIAHASAGFDRENPNVVFDGQAYAALSNDAIGSDLENKIGKGAVVSLSCDGTSGKTKTNNVAAQDVPGTLKFGDGITTAFGGAEGDAQVARTTSTVSGVNLMGGMVKVKAIQAVAQSSITGGVVTGTADGSGFSGLTVAGIAIPADLPPNTALTLPGIGDVVVNEQTVKKDGTVKVNGLHVTVTNADNLLGLPAGSEITVAHADASVAPF